MEIYSLRKEIDKLEKQREMVKKNKIAYLYNQNYEKYKKDIIIKSLKEEIKDLKMENKNLKEKIVELQNENIELGKKRSYRKSDNPIKSKEYKEFRKKILERDNYTCQKCGSKEKLQVHHIKSRKKYPELIMNEQNCITLCIVCHAMTDNYFSQEVI